MKYEQLESLTNSQFLQTTGMNRASFKKTIDLLHVLGLDSLVDELQPAGFKNAFLQHDQFLLSLLTTKADADASPHGLFTLLRHADNRTLLKNWLKNRSFKKKLLEHPQFILALLATLPNQANASGLFQLLLSPDGREILENWLKYPGFKKALLQHPQFIPTLLTLLTETVDDDYVNLSVLYRLFIFSEQNYLFHDWIKVLDFKKRLLQHSQFVPTLLARRPDTLEKFANLSALYSLLVLGNGAILADWVKNTTFKKALLRHPELFPTLIAKMRETSETFDNTSVLSLLADSLPQNQELLEMMFSCSQFKQWLLEPRNLQQFIDTFFMRPQFNARSSIFVTLLSKKKSGQQIMTCLLQHPSLNKGIFDHFSIPDEAHDFVNKLISIQTEAGFYLINALSKTGCTSLLRCNNLQLLFKHPQIQQLIKMNQVKPEWFLFIAANQPDNHSDISFLLNQDSISAWTYDRSGHFLYDMIADLSIPTIDKTRLKRQMQRSLEQQPAKNSAKNVWMHLNITDTEELPSSPSEQSLKRKAEEPAAFFDESKSSRKRKGKKQEVDENLSAVPMQIDSSTPEIVLPKKRKLTKKDKIKDVENELLQKFYQYIDWLLSQDKLSDYHPSFQELSKNKAIFNSRDLNRVVRLLEEKLCPAINAYLAQRNAPTFDRGWELTECTRGVLDCLNQMYVTFTGEHPFSRHINDVKNTAISRYNALFAIPKIMEVHAPTAMIETHLGQPFQGLPDYDPYVLTWSEFQKRCVAQNCAEGLINPAEWLDRDMLQPLLDLIKGALSVSDSEYVTEIKFSDLSVEHPLMLCLEVFNQSALFQTPFTLCQFLSYILKLNLAEVEESFVNSIENKIEGINVDAVLIDLKTDLQRRLAVWLEHPAQKGIPQQSLIEESNTLLWQFLTKAPTDRATKVKIDDLLNKISLGVDGPALIKYCLLSHQDNVHLLKLDTLFEPLACKTHTTLFSILASNPFYAAWLFDHEIKTTVLEQEGSTQFNVEFLESNEGSGLQKALFQHKLFNTELGYLLIQPGTIFFWLYYFQQKPEYQELFQIIMNYLSSNAINLSAYDSLLPLLYDIQRSIDIIDEGKAVVRNFLENRLNAQLVLRSDAYWQTACYLDDDRLTLKQRTQQHCQSHPYLNRSINKHFNAAHYLLDGALQPATRPSFFEPLVSGYMATPLDTPVPSL